MLILIATYFIIGVAYGSIIEAAVIRMNQRMKIKNEYKKHAIVWALSVLFWPVHIGMIFLMGLKYLLTP